MSTPAPDADLLRVIEEAAVVALFVAVAVAVIVGFITWLLLRAADKPPGSMVTLSLSLLSIFAIGAYIATRAEVMAAIIGTSIGALAGAVTYQLGGGGEPSHDRPHETGPRPPDAPGEGGGPEGSPAGEDD